LWTPVSAVRHIEFVHRVEFELDLFPGLHRHLQFGARFGGGGENLLAFLLELTALVARLDAGFERDAVRVRPGVKARVSFAALPDRTFEGKVTLVGKQVEPDSRTVPVRIEVENRDGSLRPGMSATAWLTVGQQAGEILSLPAASLQRLQERWIIFIPKSETEFEMRETFLERVKDALSKLWTTETIETNW
jgi:hypothetical protein